MAKFENGGRGRGCARDLCPRQECAGSFILFILIFVYFMFYVAHGKSVQVAWALDMGWRL
jgi:hypothetical protein